MPKPPSPLTNASCPRFRGLLTGPRALGMVLGLLSTLTLVGLLAWRLTPLLMHWLLPSP